MGERKPAALDFETEPIEPRPAYPPRPVGLAAWVPGDRPRYHAFGHPRGNNCSEAEAREFLRRVLEDRTQPTVFHNAKFDLDVANTHWDLPLTPRGGYHDTEFLAFLHDPHQARLGLKPLGEEKLGMPADEEAELRRWILANVPEVRRKKSAWGAYIGSAPGGKVAPYAKGDVERTRRLWDLLYADIRDRGMLEAYERELRLMPLLLESERAGVPVAHDRLEEAVEETWPRALEAVDGWLRRRLGADFLDVDKDQQLADVLEAAGLVDEWIYTAPSNTYPEGQRSTSKENLKRVVRDPAVLNALEYRSRLTNGLRNFGRPWLEMSRANDGNIHTRWHQTRRGEEREGNVGARTGRLSSTPNFQNVPKRPAPVVSAVPEGADAEDYLVLPPDLLREVAPLPNLRDFIEAPEGMVLLNRDYSQQELRILGHFEDDVLLRRYQDDPWLDVHTAAQTMINRMLGTNLPRKPIKNLGFGLIYGMGIKKLAAQMGLSVDMAKKVRDAYLAAFPGLLAMNKELKRRARRDEPLRTWGGRLYHVEPAKKIKGKLMTFEYKMLNQLIQGSAADCTKEAVINYEDRREEGRLLLTVHDEMMALAPADRRDREMARLREAMEAVEFDVAMLSEGKVGEVWARLEDYDDEREAA